MVQGISSQQVRSDSRGSASLPLAHDLANRTRGRLIASILSQKNLPNLSAEQVRELPHLITMFLQSRTSRVFTAEREPPISCLISPAQIVPGTDGGKEQISIGFTYLFYLGDELRACKVTSASALPLSPDTIQGICELHRSKAPDHCPEGQSLRIYGQEVQIQSVSLDDMVKSMMTETSLPATWVAAHLGLKGAEADTLSSIIEQTLADAPRVNATEEFVKTLDEEITAAIRSRAPAGPQQESAETADWLIVEYNKALAEFERKEGALQTPLDVEDAIRQLTPFVTTEDGAASLSCSSLLLLLREREILEDRIFQVSNETADPRLVEVLEQIDPETTLLRTEIQRRKEQGELWTPDDNVNYLAHPVDLPLSYAKGSEVFDILLSMPSWRIKNLTEEEYEALQRLPIDALLRIRDILKFFEARYSNEAELLRTIADALRSGLSEDKKVRFGGTQEEHRFAFLLLGEPSVKLEFEIGEDLDLHGSPRAFVHNVSIEEFNLGTTKGGA